MKKKRMIKLLMSLGCDRNDAARAATLADGNLPHTVVYYDLLEEFIRTYYEQLDTMSLTATQRTVRKWILLIRKRQKSCSAA